MKTRTLLNIGITLKIFSLITVIWEVVNASIIDEKAASLALWMGIVTFLFGVAYYSIAMIAKFDKQQLGPIEDVVIFLIACTYAMELFGYIYILWM